MSKNSHSEGNAIYTSLFTNASIAISKFVVSVFTMSSTMLAEAIHSSADCLNQVLLLIGEKRSQKAADETHPFGYGKENFFWSSLVALVLFLFGSVFAIYEGIHKVIHPEPVENVLWIFGLIVFAIAMEAKAYTNALKEFKEDNPGPILKAMKDSADTSLIVLLIEDSAAMIGLVIAFIFTVLAAYVNPIFDGFGSIGIGIILGLMSYFLANELRKLIVGENISRNTRTRIKKMLKEYDVVDHINNIRAMYIDHNQFLLNISIDVNDEKRAGDIESIIYDMKNYIRSEYPEAEYITIEIAKSREV